VTTVSKTALGRYWARVKARLAKRPEVQLSIRLSPEIIEVHETRVDRPPGPPLSVNWSDVVAVFVYKKDLYVVDMICMSIALKNGHEFHLDEQMAGWTDLTERLPKILPGCLAIEEWFFQVAFPAFETNLIRIYPRNEPNVSS
jgi:hypothetical protein